MYITNPIGHEFQRLHWLKLFGLRETFYFKLRKDITMNYNMKYDIEHEIVIYKTRKMLIG